MRTPPDVPQRRAARPRMRGRWWIVAVVVVLIVLVLSLKSLATLYTDALWFSAIHHRNVWSTVLAAKVGLFAAFGAAFFVVLWASLMIGDRLVGTQAPTTPEDDLVRRYQAVVRPHARWVYLGVSLLAALVAAAGTTGQWNNWILFRHGVAFGVTDPQFHWDVGFFVFKLPFLSFLVHWILVSLIAILVISAVFHYLNGGIRFQRPAPRVNPLVKVHLSVLLAGVALAKAAGYFLQRYQLDVSTSGYVEGAGYTDVHARLPALELLVLVSLAAAAILLWNIRRQGWTLPVLAVGVWAFVAVVVGAIYPAILQALKVNPAQSTLEAPYIADNIAATRAAYGLDHVTVKSYSGTTALTSQAVNANLTTLENTRLWDPNASVALPTFQKLQDVRSYYTIPSLGVDRYTIGGQMTPTVLGVRQINPQDLPATSWVNQHLQYTHGIGVALAPANQASTNGNPNFAISDVPPTSVPSLPRLTQPDIYFGQNDPGYVVADTKQAELDYQLPNGNDVGIHYQGTGGVQLSSTFTRLAFALRMNDLNLLISNLITPQSRIMFVRDIQARAEKAAPFLSFGSHPYAAVINGHVDWILNGYTTTSQYPYSQNASAAQVAPGSGLPSSYNYVRNSVKVVVNAYSGAVTFYAMDNDPILRTYEAAFPGLFVPASKMSPTLRAHLRYPDDLFSIQAAMYGRYHITNTQNFYTAGDAWSLSPTAGVGSPANALAVTINTDAQGRVVGTPPERMAPLYQVLQIPGTNQQAFTITDAYVPASQGSSIQNLAAFMVGNSDPGHYGQLEVFVTPPGHSVIGPVQADSEIQQASVVSQKISLLDQHGSSVILGNILLIPVDQSVLYVRPMYVESSGNPQPQLREVIAVFGQNVGMAPTLDGALSSVLGTKVGSSSSPSSSGSGGSGSSSAKGGSGSSVASSQAAVAAADITQAQADYKKALADLKAGNFGAFGSDIAAMEVELQAAQTALQPVTPPSKATPAAGTGHTSGTAASATTAGSATPAGTSTSSSSTASTSSSSGGTVPHSSSSAPTKSTGPLPATTTTSGEALAPSAASPPRSVAPVLPRA